MKEQLEAIEQIIRQKLDYLAHAMFYLMEVGQDNFGFSWGQINEAFCRLILNIPFDRRIEEKEVLEFQKVIFDKRREFGLIGTSLESVNQLISRDYFDFAEGKIPVYAQDRVNALLEKAGSKKRLVTGLYGGRIGYIFGEVSFQRIGNHEVAIIEEEKVRSPNRVLELAAVVIGEKIYLRRESFQNLFLNNWLSLFETPRLKINKILAKEENNILYHLRKKALEVWGIDSKEKLLGHKEKFIGEMMQLTLRHEIGHREVQRILSLDEFAIGSALANLGENVVSALGELLADWSSEGPIAYALGKHSSALLYLYLADKPESGLADYLSANLNFNLESLTEESKVLFQQRLKEFKDIVQQVRGFLEAASYKISGREISFETLVAGLKAKFKETDGYLKEETPAFKNAFWQQVLSRVPQDSIRQLLKTKGGLLPGGAAKLKSLGFYCPQPPLPLEEIYKIACYEMGLYQDEAEKVFLEYFKIIRGGGLDLKGTYRYLDLEPSLFFSLLRFMLKKIDIISPFTALTFGPPVKDKLRVKDKEEDLRVRLEKLGEFLQKEKIPRIFLFRMEKDYLSEGRLKQLLSEYHLIADAVQFVELPHQFIFDVYLQSRPDCLDSILVNAIREINQKIRSQEAEKLFSLDQPALEYLGREYLKG